MDLNGIRKSLKDKETSRERVAAEAEELRTKLSTVSKATRAAAQRAEEEALFAVITPTPEATAKAEAAKATLRSADDQEAELRDRLPLLDRALRVLDDEITGLQARLPAAVDEKVRAVLNGRLDELDQQLAELAGHYYAREKAFGSALAHEFIDVVTVRLDVPGMRQRVLDAAATVRAAIVGEVAP